MDVLVRMVEHHVWLTGELIEPGGRLDAAALDEPIELSVESFDDAISIRYLLDRLVWQEEMWLASVDDQPFQTPDCVHLAAKEILYTSASGVEDSSGPPRFGQWIAA